ncbi:hypothetical protein VTH06DRAFT_7395 [Thermothelomyces fergusii]
MMRLASGTRALKKGENCGVGPRAKAARILACALPHDRVNTAFWGRPVCNPESRVSQRASPPAPPIHRAPPSIAQHKSHQTGHHGTTSMRK